MNLNDNGFVRRVAVAALAAGAVSAAPVATHACVDGAPKGEVVTIQREVGITAAGQRADFHVMGAGWFRATEIVKQGGASDNTEVIVELDGEEVFAASFASLKNPWMQLNTPFIVAKVQSEGNTSTMTIWYSPELKFRAILAVRVEVREEGVQGMQMRAVMNKPGPHEDPPGQAATALVLPAFK
jgi:Zn-dependent protease with chaperone function